MELLEPLNKEEFNKLVEVKFNNIMEGLNKYHSKTIKAIDGENFEVSEKKYLKLMEILYNENKNIIVDFYIKKIKGADILKILNGIEEKEKIILLNQINYINEETIYFKCRSLELLRFIMKLNARELFFCTIYIVDKDITIWGNYDLKFPLFFKDKKQEDYILNIVEKLGLESY